MTVEALAIIDDPQVGARLQAVFQFLGHKLTLAADLDSLERRLDGHEDFLTALVCLAGKYKRCAAVAQLNRGRPSLPVYVLRSTDGPRCAALARGLAGEIEYPIQYRQLAAVLRNAENRRSAPSPTGLSGTLTGASDALREVRSLVRDVSMTDTNVLLLGESGTGKDVVARGIHNLSPRARQPFVAVNCRAIPNDLLESELFGHEKDAFTGARAARRGRFELAEGGTLYLDGIGEMPMPVQLKLLRVIRERVYQRAGGDRILRCNVRLIAADHRNLEGRVSNDEFHMNLFHLLSVFPIELPPLRERAEDIPALVREFADRAKPHHGHPITFGACALAALARHPLPGNVRELEKLVERLATLFPGETITVEKLPKRYRFIENQCSASPPAPPTAPRQESEERRVPFTVSTVSATKEAHPRKSRTLTNRLDLKEYLSGLLPSFTSGT